MGGGCIVSVMPFWGACGDGCACFDSIGKGTIALKKIIWKRIFLNNSLMVVMIRKFGSFGVFFLVLLGGKPNFTQSNNRNDWDKCGNFLLKKKRMQRQRR